MVVALYLAVIALFTGAWLWFCVGSRKLVRASEEERPVTPEWPETEQQIEAEESQRLVGKARGELDG